MTRILIVGGGLTGSILSSLLKGRNVSIWEKSKDALGGRMSTLKYPKKPSLSVDLGAQYITISSSAFKNKRYFRDLLDSGTLEIFDAERFIKGHRKSDLSSNFVAPKGTASVVERLALGASVHLNRAVNSIQLLNRELKVTDKNGTSQNFDIVVFTIPVPELYEVKFDFPLPLELNSIKYSSRFALGIFYEKEEVELNQDFVGEYIDDADGIMRFVSLDSKKRRIIDNSSSIVCHTTVKFGVDNLEKTEDEVRTILLEKIRELYPSWPKNPDFVICRKWRYSQVTDNLNRGFIELNSNNQPLIISGGDAFGPSSNFEGCAFSAERIFQRLCE